MITTLARVVQKARSNLEKQMEAEDMVADLTDIEDECFENFHVTLKAWIDAKRDEEAAVVEQS